MLKHRYMFKMIYNLSIWSDKYMFCTSPPIWICHSPWIWFLLFSWFLEYVEQISWMRENLFASGLQLDWLQLDLEYWCQETCLWWWWRMVMLLIDENWFLILVLVLDKVKEHRMTDELGASLMNVAGSPSLVGWMMLPYPQKLKAT